MPNLPQIYFFDDKFNFDEVFQCMCLFYLVPLIFRRLKGSYAYAQSFIALLFLQFIDLYREVGHVLYLSTFCVDMIERGYAYALTPIDSLAICWKCELRKKRFLMVIFFAYIDHFQVIQWQHLASVDTNTICIV